ncbi:hypothetical protein LB503_003778 [Fusarium chuoi]|nr:hypothetical protein LB503_003778 [Fusarium chuoi]
MFRNAAPWAFLAAAICPAVAQFDAWQDGQISTEICIWKQPRAIMSWATRHTSMDRTSRHGGQVLLMTSWTKMSLDTLRMEGLQMYRLKTLRSISLG